MSIRSRAKQKAREAMYPQKREQLYAKVTHPAEAGIITRSEAEAMAKRFAERKDIPARKGAPFVCVGADIRSAFSDATLQVLKDKHAIFVVDDSRTDKDALIEIAKAVTWIEHVALGQDVSAPPPARQSPRFGRGLLASAMVACALAQTTAKR
jgi:hypothetical protein